MSWSTPDGRRAARAAGAAVLAACCGGAMAGSAPLWEFGLGLTALRLPHYRGSDQSQNWLLPIPYLVYRGEILRADREGARAMMVETERFELDLSLAASAPTRSGDNLARAGMPNLAPTVELGPNATLRLAHGRDWKLEFRVPVRAAMTLGSHPRSIGWSAAPNLNLELRAGGWDVGVISGPLWGSRAQHAYFYDVAPEYATPSRPAYQAAAGRGGWQGTVGASRRFGALWVGMFARVDSVAGAAFAASPLVRQERTVAFGVAASWVFAKSSRNVDVDDR